MSANMLFLLAGLVLGWLTLLLGLWLYRQTRQAWRRQRYGEPIDHPALLVKYGRCLTGALGQQTLIRLLEEELPCALQVDRAVLLLTKAHQLTDLETGKYHLPVSSSAVRWVASSGEAQSTCRGRLRELAQRGPDDLSWTGAWVPLMRGADMCGLWLLGRRRGDLQFSSDDLAFLTNLGRQAAAILENIRHAEHEQVAAYEIRALYQRVVAAQEVERGRLARDLHDGVLQDLCAVNRDLKVLEAGPRGKAKLYRDLVARSGEAVHALRGICNDLRPPLLQYDLAAALKALVEQMGARSLASIHITAAVSEVHLPDELAVATFRIAQEALQNAIQHADASEIELRLTNYPDHLRLTVTDDGQGIAGGVDANRFVNRGHFGLAGMRERAAMIGAKLEVQTAQDYGTVVALDLPHRR